MAKYICEECSEDGSEVRCVVEVDIGEPEFCPVSGEVMDCGEWEKVE